MKTRTSMLLRPWAAGLVLVAFAVAANVQRGWLPHRVNTSGNDLNTVYFVDSKRGWVGGDQGFLSRTDDGGQSWVRQAVSTKDAINDIYFRDKEIGFLLAGNAIFVTRDNGNSWTKSRTFLPEEFEGAERSEERRVGKEGRYKGAEKTRKREKHTQDSKDRWRENE